MVETFSIVAAVAAAAQAGALVALHVLPTGYDPRLNAVSDYGIGRYRGWFWAQALAGPVACFALAVALGDAKPSMPSLAIMLLVIAGLARLLIPVFPTDQNGSRFQTVRGTVHMVLAIVIFAAIIVARVKARLDAPAQASLARRQGLAHSSAVGHDRRGGWNAGRRSPAEASRRAVRAPLLRVVARVVLIVSIELSRIGH